MFKPVWAIPGSLERNRERDLHVTPVESDEGCSEDGTRVPDDLLFAVGKTLSGLYAEWKTQLDTARRGFIMGLIGEDNMALAVSDADRDRKEVHTALLRGRVPWPAVRLSSHILGA